jgi:PAS domain S-box-containing protein
MGEAIRRSDDPNVRDIPFALEETLRAADVVLDLLPVATCICDLQGRIVQYNRRALEIWGRAPQPGETHAHFIGASKFFRLDGQSLAPREIPMSEVLATGKAVRDEEVLVERPDGVRIMVEVSIDPLLDPRGHLLGAIQCFQDITERNRMHAELARYQLDLREHEQRLAATYEHAAIGIVETDADGRFLRVNEAICAITGLSREELLGSSLFARTHPVDAEADREAYAKQVRGELGIYSVEKRFRRKDGREVWMSVRSSPVQDAAGRFLYGVRVVQDVTNRKAAEERQKLLVDELNHRVKNTLATVQSLATQTARGTSTPDAFCQTFTGRLMALSQAHDQLTVRHWESAELHRIIAAGAGPYFSQGQSRVVVQGGGVTLRPRAALTLAMTFHELTTNAAKYGALSTAGGRIHVHWYSEQPAQAGLPPVLRIEWREQGGPPVVPPNRRGFGSKFIVGSIASELGGGAELSFDPDGLRCTLRIPFDAAVENMQADDGSGGDPGPPPGQA